jgi:hypothetical protein
MFMEDPFEDTEDVYEAVEDTIDEDILEILEREKRSTRSRGNKYLNMDSNGQYICPRIPLKRGVKPMANPGAVDPDDYFDKTKLSHGTHNLHPVRGSCK